MRRSMVVATVLATTAIVIAPTPGQTAVHAATTTIDIVGPVGSGSFGSKILVLANGNFVVADPTYDSVSQPDVGAVYLYDGFTNQLISTLRGSSANDMIGENGVTAVGTSNFVVRSSHWDGAAVDTGAVTWVNGATGLNATVSAANSLVGGSANDGVGSTLTLLTDSNNYLVVAPTWDSGPVADAGAVAWSNGNAGVSGLISSANALIGSTPSDGLAIGVTTLPNGNYVARAPQWDRGVIVDAGAVTFGNGAVGRTGVISEAISLVGSTTTDLVGSAVTSLASGAFVVRSPNWDNAAIADAGAATWMSAAGGVTGPVTAGNSLVGTIASDLVSSGGVAGLSNSNYVVSSPGWNNALVVDAGAVTWGNGATGISGAVTTTNSMVGTNTSDRVSSGGVSALKNNGNYVIRSPLWNNGGIVDAGAATWAAGNVPLVGVVSVANSLVGTSNNDQVSALGVLALANGNGAVFSYLWNNGASLAAGAITWLNGATGIVGSVSASNSYVGGTTNDGIGGSGVVLLTNANFLFFSVAADIGGVVDAGAVTWVNGATGGHGVVSAANSVVGTTTDDQIGFGGVLALPNGNFVLGAPSWDNGGLVNAGAVFYGNGASGSAGPLTAANSLVGLRANDQIGSPLTQLKDGNYVINSPNWDNGLIVDAGASTWRDGSIPLSGAVTSANSLVGTATGDFIGNGSSVPFDDGSYVVRSFSYNNGPVTDSGAFTYADPGGLVGLVSATNSVRGAAMNGGASMITTTKQTTAQAIVVGRPADNMVTLLLPPDTTPPSFGPPSNITVPAAPGGAGAVVNYALPTAFDARGAPTVVCTPPPGSFFPIGVTTVMCVATDSAGLTASTSFTVTVAGDYVPLPPARLADTRPGFTTIDGGDAGGGVREVGSTLELQVAGRGGVAPDASAATLNVTAVDAAAPGFATAWPCGEPRPTASNLNFGTGATVPNAVIAKIGAGGKVCLFTSQPIHFVVDVNGYTPAATSYRPLNPARLLDTRADGVTADGQQQATGLAAAESTTTLQVSGRGGVPADATSVVLNVTTTESVADGYVTAFGCGTDRPNASSVNGVAQATVANLVIAKLGSGGTVCLYSQQATHLIADVNGYFAPGGSYVPLVPARLMDSRPGFTTVDGASAGSGQLALGTITALVVNGRGGVSNASTVSLNVTVTGPQAAGYISAYPCGIDPPNASNLNYTTNQTVANGAVVKVGTNGTVCLYNSQPTHLVVDITGYLPT